MVGKGLTSGDNTSHMGNSTSYFGVMAYANLFAPSELSMTTHQCRKKFADQHMGKYCWKKIKYYITHVILLISM